MSVFIAAAVLVLLATAVFAEGELFDVGEVELVWDQGEYLELDRLWDRSEELWHQGDYPATITVLRKIIELDPTQSEAYVNAAWLLDSTDRIFEGFDMLVQNIVANPRNCDAYFEVGMKYFYMGGYPEAVGKLEVSQSYNCSVNTDRLLAHAYERAGMRDDAIETYACILGRDQADGAALQNLLRVLNRISPKGDPTRLWHRPEPITD